ncbi:MAG: hypothetical protein CG438_1605, partial [Methylococcaceae bacterium NSP1-1]
IVDIREDIKNRITLPDCKFKDFSITF